MGIRIYLDINYKNNSKIHKGLAVKIRIYYEDTDLGGVVYHTNYIKYCERARSEIFFQNGTSPIIDEAHFVVRKLECDFLAPAKFGDTIEVVTKIQKIQKASFVLYQEIQRDNKILFYTTVTLVLVKNNKIKRLDNTLIDYLSKLFENK